MVLALTFLAALAHGASLDIQVTEIQKTVGNMTIALFPESEKKGFPDEGKPLREISAPVNQTGSQVFEFKNISAGTYAIALYQDKNKDGKLDVDLIGVPAEPFGFSENPRIFFGAPSFGRSSFTLGEENKKLEIKLKRF